MFFKKQHELKVIITGGPRSGTSFLAGLVNEMGFHPGKHVLLKAPPANIRKGYLEHLKLLKISRSILDKLNADFNFNIPVLEKGWTNQFPKEKAAIRKIVQSEQIDFYKGNRLLVLADIYDELFPEAKWLCIKRKTEDTYKSRFGKERSWEEWTSITENRYAAWARTNASKKAIELDYDSFKENSRLPIEQIAKHLSLTPDEKAFQQYQNYFQPQPPIA